MLNKIYKAIENLNERREDLPKISIGDIIKVTISSGISKENKKVSSKKEKESYIVKGIVIATRRENSTNYVFKVLRDDISKTTIEMIFYYHSPSIINIEVIGKINERVRRSKLYYFKRIIEKKKKNK